MGIAAVFMPLIPAIIFILILIIGIRIVQRMERRSEERLQLEKKNSTLLQQQIQEINLRLTKIEDILKEVD